MESIDHICPPIIQTVNPVLLERQPPHGRMHGGLRIGTIERIAMRAFGIIPRPPPPES